MAEENTPDPKDDPQAGVFNVDRVRELVGLMNEHELSEIDLRHGEQRVRLRRGPEQAVLAATPAAAQIAPAPAAQPAPVQAPPAETPAAAAPAAGKTINSPMVGTFYTSSSPDTAAFVKVGDQVGPDTIVCIVEAMKVFNEIPAEVSGKITEILAENGAAVEFGQPLFRVE